MGWRPVALLLFSLLASACAASAVDLRGSLDPFRDKLTAKQDLADEFLACTSRPFDGRAALPAGTIADAERTQHGPLQAIHTLIARVKEGRPAQAESLRILEETLADWRDTAYQRLDLQKLGKILDLITQWHRHMDFDEEALAEDESQFVQLLLAYNKAYFGDIRYVAGRADGAGLRAAARVTSDGFVDRNGNVWRFPGLSVDVTREPGQRPATALSQVDSKRITADLTRVFLEAFFDAAFREPAVEGATALHVQWKAGAQPYPAFDADHPPISPAAFARVTRDALRAEAAVTSEVGKAVRGGSLFSTQNETLAAGLETAAGVIAKKLVEHGGFCYFQVIQRSERRKEGVKE